MRIDPHSAYRPDVDGLRAIAVLSVIGYHAFPGFVKGGFVGVDVFFVISGFLISTNILNEIGQGTFSFANFYGRRIRRIFPGLILVLAATLVFGWFVLAPSEYIELGKVAAASTVFMANFILWVTLGYFDVAAEFKPLLHLWSLGIEEQFYIVWPLCLWILWGRRNAILSAIAIVTLLSFSLNLTMVRSDPVANFFLPTGRIWELLIGALIAYTQLPSTGGAGKINQTGRGQGWSNALRNMISGMGLLSILGSVLLFRKDFAFPGAWALLPTLGTALHIWAGPDTWINRKLSAHPWLVFLGLISYPLYLWHWPMIAYIKVLHLGWDENPMRLLKIAAILVSGLAAWLTWKFVEIPIRRAEKHRFVFPLCATMGVVFALGLTIVGVKGAPSRYGEIGSQVLLSAHLAARGYDENYRNGTCLLTARQTFRDYAPECFAKGGRDDVAGGILLWGDSEAAHFYPGLSAALRQTGIRLTQLTSNDCPPYPGFVSKDYPFCAATNDLVLEWAVKHKPKLVILAGYWFNYPAFMEVNKTVQALKAAGIEKVILVGPVPEFAEYQPKLIVRAIQNSQIPERLPTPHYVRLLEIDSVLQKIADSNDAVFVSPVSLLCDTGQCMVAAGAKVEGLMAWDRSHLTPFGSEYVVNRLLSEHIDRLRSTASN